MSDVIPITALERDLIEGGLSACTCMTKSGETKHHDRLCTYRLHTDARMKIRDLTKQLAARDKELLVAKAICVKLTAAMQQEPTLERVDMKGVGDNDGYFEIAPPQEKSVC